MVPRGPGSGPYLAEDETGVYPCCYRCFMVAGHGTRSGAPHGRQLDTVGPSRTQSSWVHGVKVSHVGHSGTVRPLTYAI